MAEKVETITVPLLKDELFRNLNQGVLMKDLIIGRRILTQALNYSEPLIPNSNLRNPLFEGIRLIVEEIY